jgi:hypothetical protein
MEQRTHLEARQVKCLTLDEGHVWIHCYDRLPAPVRRRLAQSAHNICPACLEGEATSVASARGLRQPTIAIYLGTITSIERKLGQG